MTADPDRRSAARTAALIAVPITLAVLLVSVFAFGGFGTAATGPVTMTARDLSPEVAGLCQAVTADLPETAAGHDRRPVTAGAEQNAAYGDPPITVECGTTQPEISLTADVYNLVPPGEAAGVCWYAADGPDGTVWTTVDRIVPVTVTVPGQRDAAAQSVVPFVLAIGANLPPLDTFPSGCTGDYASPTPTGSATPTA